MKVVNLEFTWRGETYNVFIPKSDIFKDIFGDKDYLGTLNGCFQYEIHWNKGYIVIYANGNTTPIDKVDNFIVRFSERY